MPETAVADVTTTSTPASPAPSSAPSSPATPSTQATTPASPASSRPTDAKSLASLMRTMDTAADATTPQSPLVVDPAAAPIVPSTSAPVAGADPNASQGPIPFQVHQTALANARTKAVQDFQRTHWSSKVSEAQIGEIRDLSVRLSTDPVGFHRWLGEQLQQHPQYRAAAAPPQAPQKPRPDVEIRDHAGNVVGMGYSATAQEQLLEWQQQQLTGQFTQQLQPFVQDREQRIQREQQQEFSTKVNAGADQVMGRIGKILDGRQDLFAHVNAIMEQHPQMDALDAAIAVREQHLVPSMKASAEAAALDANRKKAAGNTASPGAAIPAKRPTSEKELVAWMKAQDGVA